MGCKHSSTIKVQPYDGTTTNQKNKSEDNLEEYEIDENGKKFRLENGKNKHKSATKRQNKFGSSNSLDDERSMDGDRGFSATSKASADSGLGADDYQYGKDLGNIITEYSGDDAVRMVEKSFIERDDLDLGITGVQLPTRLTVKENPRQDASEILKSLQEEGFIAKPTTQSSGGVSFEIVAESSFNAVGLPRLPPRQLEKLEQRRKKKRVLTEDEIMDKLERAERRRKKRESERLNKIKALEKSDAVSALENYEQHMKEKEEQQNQKMDVVADNREKRLNEIREKIKERERRAEEVRKRKQKALEEGLITNNIISQNEEDNLEKTSD